MKQVLNLIKKAVLWIWQAPQNIVGLLFMLFLLPVRKINSSTIAIVYASSKMSGGVSLGEYAFVSAVSEKDEDTVQHEGTGHAKQSRILGPLYLIVIGIPSLIWAGAYGSIVPRTKNGYYKFYTEKWADRLAGIERK